MLTLHPKKVVLHRLYEEILNSGALDRLPEVIDPDYLGPQGQRGPAGFAEWVAEVRRAVPDVRWTLDDVLVEGDRVVAKATLRGTHAGPFRGFPPTHEPVTLRTVAVHAFRNAKLHHTALQTHRLELAAPLDLPESA